MSMPVREARNHVPGTCEVPGTWRLQIVAGDAEMLLAFLFCHQILKATRRFGQHVFNARVGLPQPGRPVSAGRHDTARVVVEAG